MSAELPMGLRAIARRQAGIVARKQAIATGMSSRAIGWKVQSAGWRQVYRGVYATFTGMLPRRAQLWAAVLYAGEWAMLSHVSAAEIHGLVDEPSEVIHVTVPARRRVRPAPGLVIHGSDVPQWPDADPGAGPGAEVPATAVHDTVIDLAEACTSVDDVYGWVARAFGRKEVAVNLIDLLVAVQLRAKLRWRAELTEAIVAASGGAHSVLELLWDKNVEVAHGLPVARKQVPFTKEDGRTGFRDREYVPWGVIIEHDGKKSHPDEQRGKDRARDRRATVGSKETMRYGWRETRYEGCRSAVEVIRVLWRRGWRGRPKPCSRDCPVAALLRELDMWLAQDPVRQRAWLEQQAVHEADRRARAEQDAAGWKGIHQVVDDVARARREMQAAARPVRHPAKLRRAGSLDGRLRRERDERAS